MLKMPTSSVSALLIMTHTAVKQQIITPLHNVAAFLAYTMFYTVVLDQKIGLKASPVKSDNFCLHLKPQNHFKILINVTGVFLNDIMMGS
jgi:hypothetical protein